MYDSGVLHSGTVRTAVRAVRSAGWWPAKTRAEIAEQIRPSSYFNQKAAYLKAFSMMLDNEFGGSLDRLFRLDTPALRKKLLAVKGIGPETADSILLYAAQRPLRKRLFIAAPDRSW